MDTYFNLLQILIEITGITVCASQLNIFFQLFYIKLTGIKQKGAEKFRIDPDLPLHPHSLFLKEALYHLEALFHRPLGKRRNIHHNGKFGGIQVQLRSRDRIIHRINQDDIIVIQLPQFHLSEQIILDIMSQTVQVIYKENTVFRPAKSPASILLKENITDLSGIFLFQITAVNLYKRCFPVQDPFLPGIFINQRGQKTFSGSVRTGDQHRKRPPWIQKGRLDQLDHLF